MINPLTTQLLPPVPKSSSSAKSFTEVERSVPAPRTGGGALAQSIMQDGGLGFLRSRMEESMGALFEKAAELNPEMAAAGPEAFFDTSVDVSPEATASRIVGFALGLKGVYSRQNSEMSEEEMMGGFEEEIRLGIKDGFSNARGILGDLDLLSGDISSNVDATWDLVQQKLNDFFHPSEED